MAYQWDFAAVFRHTDLLAAGALNTFRLAGASILVAVPLGLVVALVRMSRLPVLSQLATVYTELFRAAPAIVLIYWFFFAFPLVVDIDLPTFAAALLALGLQTSAYLAEVFRGGILAVDRGQWNAATALGMGGAARMRHIILPQAVRAMIPIFFTRITELYKTTSLAAAIAYGEIVHSAGRAASETFRPVETYTVVALFFFVTILCVSQGVRLVERRMAIPR